MCVSRFPPRHRCPGGGCPRPAGAAGGSAGCCLARVSPGAAQPAVGRGLCRDCPALPCPARPCSALPCRAGLAPRKKLRPLRSPGGVSGRAPFRYLVNPVASEKSSPESSVLPSADKIFACARHGWRLPLPPLPHLNWFQAPPAARRGAGERRGGRRRCAGPRRSPRPPAPRVAPLPALLAEPAGRRTRGGHRHGNLREEERKPVSFARAVSPSRRGAGGGPAAALGVNTPGAGGVRGRRAVPAAGLARRWLPRRRGVCVWRG